MGMFGGSGAGGWSTGIGGQYWGGKTKIGDTDLTPLNVYNTKAWAVDAQAQGAVGSMPLGVYLTYGNADGKEAGSTATNIFNSNPNNKTGWSALMELGVLHGKATVALGYRGGDTGAATGSSSRRG